MFNGGNVCFAAYVAAYVYRLLTERIIIVK